MARQYVVGVDIGGQTSKIGVVDARGEVLAQSVIRTDTFGDDANAYTEFLPIFGIISQRNELVKHLITQ